jgi:pyrimidine-specific ribonucleoside hydrolase
MDHDPHGIAPAAVDVCLEVEAERYAELWLETVSGARSRAGTGART